MAESSGDTGLVTIDINHLMSKPKQENRESLNGNADLESEISEGDEEEEKKPDPKNK